MAVIINEVNTVNTYEGMFLLDSNKYSSRPNEVTGEVLQILQKVGAEVLASRPWQEGKLAYFIEGHRKGLHFLTYFRIDGKLLTEVNRLCKLSESILRHMVIKLDPALVEPMLAVATGESVAEKPSTETPLKNSTDSAKPSTETPLKNSTDPAKPSTETPLKNSTE